MAETGKVLREITRYLEQSLQMKVQTKQSNGAEPHVFVRVDDLKAWHDIVVEAAAELDPDNPPLTPEELKQMKRVKSQA